MQISNLVLIRKKFKITQKQIAEVINKSDKTVSLKENGSVPFTQEEIIRISNFIKNNYDDSITIMDIFFTKNITESVG